MADSDIDNLDLGEENDTQTTTEVTETPTPAPETTPAPQETDKPAETTEVDKTAGDTETSDKESQAQTTPGEPPVAEDKPAGEEPPKDAPKPLTADEVRSILTEVRTEERDSGKAIAETEQEVLNAYYPQGLSTTLVDEKTGQEIRTPQDVVDLSGGEMTIEEASSWLMNEQFKLKQQVEEIKQSARELAETNYNFKQGAVRVLEQYKPIFEKYPQLQQKVYKNYMKAVKMDNEKDLVLAAPDIEEYYRDFMEPYVMAFSYQAPATTTETAPTEDKPKIPESKQTPEDRMDVGGDGGSGGGGSDADPNDPESSLSNLFGE